MLEQTLATYRRRIDDALERYLPVAKRPPERLHAAMRYAVMAPGKRIRPVLTYATGVALGSEIDALDAPAASVELIHAYSLVHDDLPAMDDDDLRRGRPTCHREFDEATAILVGDALQALAFDVLLAGPFPAAVLVPMARRLAEASGSLGMAGGQALDLAAVGQQLSLDDLEAVHAHKTGALIRASVHLGYLGSACDDPDIAARLERYASCIGLAFQVQDDILDVEGDTAVIGKPQGSDADADKSTYPDLLGLDGAKRTARALCDEAVECLSPIGAAAATLVDIARYIVDRDR